MHEGYRTFIVTKELLLSANNTPTWPKSDISVMYSMNSYVIKIFCYICCSTMLSQPMNLYSKNAHSLRLVYLLYLDKIFWLSKILNIRPKTLQCIISCRFFFVQVLRKNAYKNECKNAYILSLLLTRNVSHMHRRL